MTSLNKLEGVLEHWNLLILLSFYWSSFVPMVYVSPLLMM